MIPCCYCYCCQCYYCCYCWRHRSGTLGRTEFLALYLSLCTERVKANPLVRT